MQKSTSRPAANNDGRGMHSASPTGSTPDPPYQQHGPSDPRRAVGVPMHQRQSSVGIDYTGGLPSRMSPAVGSFYDDGQMRGYPQPHLVYGQDGQAYYVVRLLSSSFVCRRLKLVHCRMRMDTSTILDMRRRKCRLVLPSRISSTLRLSTIIPFLPARQSRTTPRWSIRISIDKSPLPRIKILVDNSRCSIKSRRDSSLHISSNHRLDNRRRKSTMRKCHRRSSRGNTTGEGAQFSVVYVYVSSQFRFRSHQFGGIEFWTSCSFVSYPILVESI